jgi:HNH endonuclease
MERRKNYRRIYQQHFGPIPVDDMGRSYHIHHRDGNHSNNAIENLQAVSLQEHYEIHLAEGNTWAALRLAQRLGMSGEDISRLSKETNRRRVAEGTHPFQRPGVTSYAGKRGIEHVKKNGWSQEAIRKRVETRKKKSGFGNMEQTRTPEAIKKRVATRKANVGYKTATDASTRSKAISSLTNLCNHFQQKFSWELLEAGRRKKICRVKRETIERLLSEEYLASLWS